MKIVLCTHRFLPRFMGGVEIYTLRLARALQNLGHAVQILSGEPTPKRDLSVELREEMYEGVPVTRLSYDYDRRSVIHKASYNDPLVTSQLQTSLQKWQPDIVHATSLSLLMAGVIEAAANLNLPLIYTATDFVLTCRRGTYLKWDNCICTEKQAMALCTECVGPHTPLENKLDQLWSLVPKRLTQPLLPIAEKLISKRADFVYAAPSIQHRLMYLPSRIQQIERIIAPSTYMRHMLILNEFPPERIIVSPYGVELPEAGFKKIPSAKLRFGFIGRVTSIKGVHLLLEAFALLPRQEQIQLTIYGDAEVKSNQYMAALQERAAQLPNIEFAGFVDNTNIANLYRRLDVLVVPSIWPENSPITILEAQAYGIPVIASDVQGIADLVRHEVNGLIFANHSVEDLASQMARCLNSPELVTRLAHQSQPSKSIAVDAGAIARVYEEVLKAKSS